MIFGRHKKQLQDLMVENERLKQDVKSFKDSFPQILEYVQVIHDMNSIGVGMVEIRRVNPDSVFKVRP